MQLLKQDGDVLLLQSGDSFLLQAEAANSSPVIDVQPSNVTVEEGQLAVFTVVATDPDGDQLYYQWYDAFDDSPEPGETSDTYTFTTVLGDDTYETYVVVSDGISAPVVSNTVLLTVTPVAPELFPPVITQQPSSVLVQEGNSAVFSVVATSPYPITYQWYQDGVPAGTDSSSYSVGAILAMNGEEVYVTLTNADGMVQSDTVTLFVSEAPVIGDDTLQINDVKYEALGDLGYTGASPHRTLQWLQANGATADDIPDAWGEMLAAKGMTSGVRAVDWNQLLEDQGFTGSLKEKEHAFWTAGGTFA